MLMYMLNMYTATYATFNVYADVHVTHTFSVYIERIRWQGNQYISKEFFILNNFFIILINCTRTIVWTS